jgi:biotin operon repressor
MNPAKPKRTQAKTAFAPLSERELKRLLSHSYHPPRKTRKAPASGAGAPRRRWTAEEDALLGTMSDQKLARKLGRPVRTVIKRREVKHIWLLKKPWRPEDDKILGTRPDSQVAKMLGRRLLTVAARRRSLGVRCFYQHRPWLEHELELLGLKSDQEVACLTGHPPGAVDAKRQKLKIPPAHSALRQWSKEEIALIGVVPNRKLAQRLNCSRDIVAHKRRRLGIAPCLCRPWQPKELEMLGVKSDQEVARLTGRSRTAVALKRQKLKRDLRP